MARYFSETGRLGKRGVYTIPITLRNRFGLSGGSLVIAEEREDGILLRHAVATPVEIYSAERAAGLLLSNAVDADDYEAARVEVESMGLEPDRVPHRKPA